MPANSTLAVKNLNVQPALKAAVMLNFCTFNYLSLSTTSVPFKVAYYTGNKHHYIYIYVIIFELNKLNNLS